MGPTQQTLQATNQRHRRVASIHSVSCRTTSRSCDFTCKFRKFQSKIVMRRSNVAQCKTANAGVCFSGTIRSVRGENRAPTMDNAFMREAIRQAVENVRSGRGGPFAALVVKDGRIIAAGSNSVTSTNDPTAHAEVTAIREACRTLGAFQLTGCEIYTSCEPCPMCLGAIYWARPDRVYFAATASDAAAAGFDDSFIYEELKRPHSGRRIPFEAMMREAGLEPFRAWMQKEDRIRY
jgi:guanine deaminase